MVSATTTDAAPIETVHDDMIHAQLDYYGKRLATCSDRAVKVFNIVDSEPSKSGGQTLKRVRVPSDSLTLTLIFCRPS